MNAQGRSSKDKSGQTPYECAARQRSAGSARQGASRQERDQASSDGVDLGPMAHHNHAANCRQCRDRQSALPRASASSRSRSSADTPTWQRTLSLGPVIQHHRPSSMKNNWQLVRDIRYYRRDRHVQPTKLAANASQISGHGVLTDAADTDLVTCPVLTCQGTNLAHFEGDGQVSVEPRADPAPRRCKASRRRLDAGNVTEISRSQRSATTKDSGTTPAALLHAGRSSQFSSWTRLSISGTFAGRALTFTRTCARFAEVMPESTNLRAG